MHDINKDIELSKYRYSLAKQTYNNERMCFDNGFYRDCINHRITRRFMQYGLCWRSTLR